MSTVMKYEGFHINKYWFKDNKVIEIGEISQNDENNILKLLNTKEINNFKLAISLLKSLI